MSVVEFLKKVEETVLSMEKEKISFEKIEISRHHTRWMADLSVDATEFYQAMEARQHEC